MMNLSVSVSSGGEQGDIGVVRLGGELDIATSSTLRQSLNALSDDGFRDVVLDLGGVTFCDSTGLGEVATYARGLMEAGGSLVLAALRPDVESVFSVSGLSKVIPTVRTAAHGVDLITAERS